MAILVIVGILEFLDTAVIQVIVVTTDLPVTVDILEFPAIVDIQDPLVIQGIVV